LTYSEFRQAVKAGDIESVTITNGNQVEGKLKNGENLRTVLPSDYPKIIEELEEGGVVIDVKETSTPAWLSFLINASPFILLFGFWIFMMRQMQAGGNKALSFGKSRARLLTSQQKKVTFKDVAGVDEAKEELQEIIEFLREPQKFQKLGGRIPKGVLLVGPPGTGKTLLARAIAGEANVPFFSISGSDFVEMFVGVGASRVRDLFEQGKKSAPCIIFIDEIDAVGRHRGAGLGGGHDEREQTLNQLLVEMDGFDSNEGVILVAATNRPDVLDPALLRPGRFDRRVVVNRPDVRGREGILRVHTRKVPLANDVDLRVVARGTPGFSGADLANLCNEAALFAARQNRKVVAMNDFELAKDKVMMGAERRSMILTEAEKKNTAYHEAGHALVAALEPHADPLHKVTIIPRGQALGVTMQLPLDDKHTYSRDFLKARLAILMGGRIAEELFLDHMTTGAGNDIEQATEMARQMVCEWGMSSMGPLTFGKKEEQIFLGREIAQHRDYSEATAIRIDAEVSNLVKGAYSYAKKMITDHSEAMVRIAEALLEREVLDGEEVLMLVQGKQLPALATPAAQTEDDSARPQEVLRPDAAKPKRVPGLSEGESPSPA
jgi:cell division protease FtsH